jgi:DNA-binding transcriptional regulator GbsR (MarR family)
MRVDESGNGASPSLSLSLSLPLNLPLRSGARRHILPRSAEGAQMEKAERFVERMGLFFENEGGPRIAGRLFAHLLLQDEPQSLDVLAKSLRVSKASISTNARLLVDRGLLERVSRPGDRRDYYGAAPDQSRTVELRLQGVRQMGDLLDEALRAMPRRRSGARDRIERMIELNREASSWLDDMLARWRRRKG